MLDNEVIKRMTKRLTSETRVLLVLLICDITSWCYTSRALHHHFVDKIIKWCKKWETHIHFVNKMFVISLANETTKLCWCLISLIQPIHRVTSQIINPVIKAFQSIVWHLIFKNPVNSFLINQLNTTKLCITFQIQESIVWHLKFKNPVTKGNSFLINQLNTTKLCITFLILESIDRLVTSWWWTDFQNKDLWKSLTGWYTTLLC